MDLTDKQWAVLEPIFRPRRRPDGRGRPSTERRAVLNSVLWILRTGAPWYDLPTRLIGDGGYDSDALDQQLMTTCGIEMIAAHRRGRHQPMQDGRCLRRARHRRKVERLFACLQNYRRLVTRWERHAANFVAMLHLACARILGHL